MPEQNIDEQDQAGDGDATDAGEQQEHDTFPRSYVEQLRQEAAEHRTRAAELETQLSESKQALWTARVAATGLLRDPSALPYAEDLLEDSEALTEAARALVTDKPYLASVGGNAGQGRHSDQSAGQSISGLLAQL